MKDNFSFYRTSFYNVKKILVVLKNQLPILNYYVTAPDKRKATKINL
jgi:hypothetical protein